MKGAFGTHKTALDWTRSRPGGTTGKGVGLLWGDDGQCGQNE